MAAIEDVRRVQEGQRGLTYLSVAEGVQKFMRELIFDAGCPEVLIFGSLGTNSPLGQLDFLDQERKEVVAIYKEDGMISDRTRNNLLERVTKFEEGKSMIVTNEIHLDEDLFLLDHRVDGDYVYPGVLHVETFLQLARTMVEKIGNKLPLTKLYDVNFMKFIKHFEKNPLILRAIGTYEKITPTEIEISTKLKSDFTNSKGVVLEKIEYTQMVEFFSVQRK
ncbi:MAG: polyketide synthase dehydratase domain-containing protein [Halanaerobiales bacterium]|nr:polyketide synthase dehydratase domain-containing protein [Halanaerobiales bacterium]